MTLRENLRLLIESDRVGGRIDPQGDRQVIREVKWLAVRNHDASFAIEGIGAVGIPEPIADQCGSVDNAVEAIA